MGGLLGWVICLVGTASAAHRPHHATLPSPKRLLDFSMPGFMDENMEFPGQVGRSEWDGVRGGWVGVGWVVRGAGA